MIDDDIDPMDLDPLKCLTESDQIELIKWQWDPDWTPPPEVPAPPGRAQRVWAAVVTFETVLGILTLSAGTLLLNAERIPLVVAFIVSATVYGLAKLWFDVPSPQPSEPEAPLDADDQLLLALGIPEAQMLTDDLTPRYEAALQRMLSERHW